MDHPSQVSKEALRLLRHLVEVGNWVKSNDPRARPYIEAGAVRMIDWKPAFHRDRFLEVLSREREADA